MGTWNSTLIGGRDHAFGRTVRTNSKSADNIHSAFPGNLLILHTIAFCSGSYFARPKEFLIFDLEVFFGTGTLITTWVANNFSEKLAMTFRLMEHLAMKSKTRWRNQIHEMTGVIILAPMESNSLCLTLLLNRRNQPKW